MNYTFATVITQEGSWYVARCVELGVVSQGRSIEDAQKNLQEAVELYLEDKSVSRRRFGKRAPLISSMQVQHG